MKQKLFRLIAFVLCLSIVITGFNFAPVQVTAKTVGALEYGPDRIYKFNTYYAKFKDNKAYEHNKALWKAQRTDQDALEKYARDNFNDKDITALAKEITASSKDDYAKMKAIYKWVAENIYYDYPAYRGNTYILDERGDVSSVNPRVIYERRRAVCSGYAIFTVALFRAIGIPAKTISGPVKKDKNVGHAWMQAWLESEKRWVIMDTTWGSGNKYDDGMYMKGSVNYTYFDISLKNLSKTHVMMHTSELWNQVWWHPNVKGEPNTYIVKQYKSGVTWKKPPKNEGYTFGGWYKDETFTTKWNFDKDKVYTDVHLYAKWTINTYTVKFDSNGGSEVPSVQVEYGSRLTKPKDPTKKGYIFGGWTYKKNGKEFWNFIREPNIATVKSDITLYASWQTPYTITFDSCGGSPVPSNKTGYNGIVQQPSVTPKKDGYTFAGWYFKANAKDADRKVSFGAYSVKKDTTFYARWIAGGSSSSSSTVKPTITPTNTPVDTVVTQTPTPTPASGITPDLSAAPIENGVYNIQPANNTALNIDVPKSSLLNGASLIYYKSTVNDNQKFIVKQVGENKYTITAVHSGMNWNSSGIKGGRITQATANSNDHQIFTIMKYSDGYYRIKDCNELFVGASSKKAVNNTSVLLYTEATDRGQEFIFTKIDTALTPVPTPTPVPTSTPTQTSDTSSVPYLTSDTIESGTYMITSLKNPSLSIDVPSSSLEDGVGLIYYPNSNNNNQKFRITKVGENQYTITAVHSGKNWVSPGNVVGLIKQSVASNSKNQIFAITKYKHGTYRIQDYKGYFIGATGGNISKGSSVLLENEMNDGSQEFMILKERTNTPITPIATPTPTPTPTATPEPSIMPPYTKSITTDGKTIKEGWYYFICNNNFIRANNTKAILSKEEYASMLYIKPMGGKLYTIRTVFGTYLATKDAFPKNGDSVLVENVPEDGILTGWVIEIESGNNTVSIRPLNNKNLVVSAESGSVVLRSKPTKPENAQIILIPVED